MSKLLNIYSALDVTHNFIASPVAIVTKTGLGSSSGQNDFEYSSYRPLTGITFRFQASKSILSSADIGGVVTDASGEVIPGSYLSTYNGMATDVVYTFSSPVEPMVAMKFKVSGSHIPANAT